MWQMAAGSHVGCGTGKMWMIFKEYLPKDISYLVWSSSALRFWKTKDGSWRPCLFKGQVIWNKDGRWWPYRIRTILTILKEDLPRNTPAKFQEFLPYGFRRCHLNKCWWTDRHTHTRETPDAQSQYTTPPAEHKVLRWANNIWNNRRAPQGTFQLSLKNFCFKYSFV